MISASVTSPGRAAIRRGLDDEVALGTVYFELENTAQARLHGERGLALHTDLESSELNKVTRTSSSPRSATILAPSRWGSASASSVGSPSSPADVNAGGVRAAA